MRRAARIHPDDRVADGVAITIHRDSPRPLSSVCDGDNVVIGTPRVANATVSASVLSHGRHDKIRIIKFRRRKHHRKQMGHRQNYTEVKITAISQ